MLVLTRRIGETINIGDDIKITFTSVAGKSIQLTIDAPLHVAVQPKELYQAKQAGDVMEVKRAS